MEDAISINTVTKSIRALQIVIAPHIGTDNKISITGPERRAANLISKWKDKGVLPVVCYPERGNLRSKFVEADVEVIDYEIGNKFNIPAVKKLRLIIDKTKIQLIHTQGPASLDLIACLAGWLEGVPVIITRPVMIEDQKHYSQLRRRIYSTIDQFITLKITSKVVAVSKIGYDHLKHHCKVPQWKLQLIHNGIDLDIYKSEILSKENKSKINPVVISMVAQLFQPKGWFDFIEVIKQLKNNGYKVNGKIIGEGEMRTQLESKVKEYKLLDVIEFCGYQSDVKPLLEKSDIFLFTSYREGLSVAIIEALAMGLPIVATDVGGIREQVNESNGFIVKAGDIENLVKYTEKLIEEPALRDRMGGNSRVIAESFFSESNMLELYSQCYKNTISNN